MGPFMDEKSLAELLRMSLAGIRRWRYAGVGPKFSKFGSAVRYSLSDVEQWIASRPTGGGTSC
jgi:predicted DNA-binding transcriptional regulator AlpA